MLSKVVEVVPVMLVGSRLMELVPVAPVGMIAGICSDKRQAECCADESQEISFCTPGTSVCESELGNILTVLE